MKILTALFALPNMLLSAIRPDSRSLEKRLYQSVIVKMKKKKGR